MHDGSLWRHLSRIINMTSTIWCDATNDFYHYKAFNPWENVKPALGMQ